ncbi:hypothetical protein ACE6H2_000700 [Prunus campanulata]
MPERHILSELLCFQSGIQYGAEARYKVIRFPCKSSSSECPDPKRCHCSHTLCICKRERLLDFFSQPFSTHS